MYQESSYGNDFFTILKSVGIALGFSFIFTIIFAMILTVVPLSEGTIYAVNQTAKVACILAATLLFIRGEKGWLKGGGVGLLYTALSYLAFSAIGGGFSFSWLIFLELTFALVAGSLGGIVGVNLKNNL